MSDPADVILSFLGCELHMLGQMEVPVLSKGQVGLLCIGDFYSILQDLDGDIGWMELTQMADQGVFLAVLSWVTTVHLNFGWS